MNRRSLATLLSIVIWLALAGSAAAEENRSITRVREDLKTFLQDGAEAGNTTIVVPRLASFDVTPDAEEDAYRTVLTTRAARAGHGGALRRR